MIIDAAIIKTQVKQTTQIYWLDGVIHRNFIEGSL